MQKKTLLGTTKGSTSQSIEREINAEVVRIISIIKCCEIQSLSKLIDAMELTLNFLRLNTNREISMTSGSQGIRRNIKQQRRFKKSKGVTTTQEVKRE